MQTPERAHKASSPRVGDLWKQMHASLERGRSSASKAKSEYARVYFKLQQENALLSTEEKQIYHLRLCGLWKLIPRAMREEIADRSPEKVLAAAGIAGSEE